MKTSGYSSDIDLFSDMLKKKSPYGLIAPTVQRSHRFPADMFNQIENMARMADTSVSVVINQLIACGIEAVSKNLDEKQLSQVNKAPAAEHTTKCTHFGILKKSRKKLIPNSALSKSSE